MSISSQSLLDGVIPEDYFSFESILAEQQKIACVFKKSMFGLGKFINSPSIKANLQSKSLILICNLCA